ncbi:MAG: GNAT family N-acetyltransferase [Lutibacter sp.]
MEIKALNKIYNKKEFDCGYELLNNYIQKQAKQDVNKDLSACFVLINKKKLVIGYYTLSANSVPRDDFEDEFVRKLPPSYSDLPTILLGRLAITESSKGNGYGEVLLMDAFERCVSISENLGTLAIIVDPIDSKAQTFYEKYGFIFIPGTKKMFIPMKTVIELID